MSNFQSATGLLAKAARAANINVMMQIFHQYFFVKRGCIATSDSEKEAKGRKLNEKPLRRGGLHRQFYCIALVAGSAHEGLSLTQRSTVILPESAQIWRNIGHFCNGIERMGRERRPWRDRVGADRYASWS